MLSVIPKRYARDIWTIFFARIVTASGFAISMPFFSLYLNNELGIRMTVVGIILMSATLVGAILGVYGGELSDRKGRKWVMVRALIWRFVLFAIMAYFIARRSNIFIITALLIANSAFGAFFIPASQSYVADLTSPEKRTRAYGLLRIGGNFGWALGLIVGGLLVTIDYALLFYFTSLSMFIAAILVIILSKESLPSDRHPQDSRTSIKDMLSVAKDTRFLLFTTICVLVYIVWGQLIYPLSVYSVNVIGITKPQLSILFTINGLMVVFFQYFITNLIPAKRELAALWIGAFVYGFGYLFVGFAGGLSFLIFSVIIITIGEMIVTPTSLSYASIIALDTHKGRYLGFFNLAQSLGWAVAPLIGGILIDTFTGKSISSWAIIASLAFISAIGFIIFGRKYKTHLRVSMGEPSTRDPLILNQT